MTTTTIREATIEADQTVPAIHITRDFRATPAQLFRAHTDKDLFTRWVGPNGMATEVLRWDPRNGGEWRYVARRDGEEYTFRGCFHPCGRTPSCRPSPSRACRTPSPWRPSPS